MKEQTILMFANTDWYLYNFRLALGKEYQNQGFKVVMISPANIYGPKLNEAGFEWIPIDLDTRSMNPFKELAVLFNLWRIFRKFKPVLLHTFTIKPALYGSFIARLLGNIPFKNTQLKDIQVINGITGLGHIFTAPGLRARIIRKFVKLLYRMILSSRRVQVIFQNEEDVGLFIDQKLVKKKQTNIVRGSGVNCDLFKPTRNQRKKDRVKVLFASRLIKEKGIHELMAAKELLKYRDINCEFIIAGDIYEANPTSLTRGDVEKMSEDNWIRYVGHVEDMERLIPQADIVVLPSYREGTPKILLEAAACGKPIVASDIAGCRGVVQHGRNGYLVPAKEIAPLAEAIEELVSDPEKRRKFGSESRNIALTHFDEKIINRQTLDVVRQSSLTCIIP